MSESALAHHDELERVMHWTPAKFGVDENKRMMLKILDHNGNSVVLDLTAEIERIAQAAVDEHMKKWHGQNLWRRYTWRPQSIGVGFLGVSS